MPILSIAGRRNGIAAVFLDSDRRIVNLAQAY
jgi:hypothetical protein